MGGRSPSITRVGSMFGAKLSPPELPNGHVGRTSLLEVIGDQGDGRLVSITAPARRRPFVAQ